MGEIAELMLEGLLCQGCGQDISDENGEGTGYPAFCEGCQGEANVDAGGAPRKYYAASPAGRKLLAAGLAEWHSARDAIDAVLGSSKQEVHA